MLPNGRRPAPHVLLPRCSPAPIGLWGTGLRGTVLDGGRPGKGRTFRQGFDRLNLPAQCKFPVRASGRCGGQSHQTPNPPFGTASPVRRNARTGPVHPIKIARKRSFFPKGQGHVLRMNCWALFFLTSCSSTTLAIDYSVSFFGTSILGLLNRAITEIMSKTPSALAHK